MGRQTTRCHSHRQHQQDCVAHLAPSAAQRHTSRLLRHVAWLQLGCCIVFIGLLLLLDRPNCTSRQQQQTQVAQQPPQQYQQHDGTAAHITPSQVDTKQQQLPTPDAPSDAHCLHVMVCTLLSKSSHTAHLYKKHCSNPDIRHSRLLPSCTLSAAKVSLLLLDTCGLLLAVALLHLTSARDWHTTVPAWAWDPYGSLPLCQQQLRMPDSAAKAVVQFRACRRYPLADFEGGSLVVTPVAATVEEEWLGAAIEGPLVCCHSSCQVVGQQQR